MGSGKTALVDALCKKLRDQYQIAVITNDIYTREDAEFLVRSGALDPERIVGVETGGCPWFLVLDGRLGSSACLTVVTESGAH